MGLNNEAALELFARFNEGSGTSAADASGKGRTIALTNTPTWVSGIPGSALNFAAASSEFGTVTGWKGVVGTAARSVCFWFRTTQVGASGLNYVISWGVNTPGAGWRISIESGVVWMRGNAVTGRWGGGRNDGTWNFACLTFPAGGLMQDVKCYLYRHGDGAPVNEIEAAAFTGATTALNTGNTPDVEIGRDVFSSTIYYSGDLDELRVYSRQLSQAEVESIVAHTYIGVRTALLTG